MTCASSAATAPTPPTAHAVNPYNNTHTADPDINRRWDAQYPSLWVTNGGGGTFADIWTPSTFAQAGLYVSDTTTPGRVYELSSEHHVRTEVKLDRVENWEIIALQTEEERGESAFALPLEISRSRNITVANYHGYRVISSYQPFCCAVKVSESSDIRIRNMHNDSNSKVAFDNSLVVAPTSRTEGDSTTHSEVRPREFASLDIPGDHTAAGQNTTAAVLEPGAHVERLATGFFNISGATTDNDGQTLLRRRALAAHLSLVPPTSTSPEKPSSSATPHSSPSTWSSTKPVISSSSPTQGREPSTASVPMRRPTK